MPDKSARRVERPEGGPQGERSESSREINKLDPGLRRGDDLFRVSLSMSEAKTSFEYGIQDAEDLPGHFDAINTQPPPENAEVLKRAGLVMALTARETCVEDRVSEALDKKLSIVAGSYAGAFIQKRLQLDLKQFHNPTAEKTKRLFSEYLEVDVSHGWRWANTEPARAKKLLNEWIAKRGDALHHSRPVNNGSPVPHLIKRDELAKTIRFIKVLVNVTDAYLDASL